MYVKKRLTKRTVRKSKKTAKPHRVFKRATTLGVKRPKSMMKMIRVKNDGINATFDHMFNRPNAWMKNQIKRFSAETPIIYQHVNPYQIAVPNGSQAYNYSTHYSVSDLLNISAVAGNGAAGTPSYNNTAKIFHMKATVEYRMTNSSNAQCNIDCYVFRAKRDCDFQISTLWANGLNDMYYPYTLAPTTYGTNPLDCITIKTYFDCVRKVAIVLQPGQSHAQRFTKHKYCPINNEQISTENNNAVYLKNWTEVVLFVCYGQPMSGTVAGGVTTTQSNIDIIQSETYSFKKAQTNITQFSYSNTGFAATAGILYNQGSGNFGSSASG